MLPGRLFSRKLLIKSRRVLLRRFERVEADADLRTAFLEIVLADKLALAFFSCGKCSR